MQRYLDQHEERFQHIKLFTRLGFEYRGAVDPDSFSSALNTFTLRHPVIRGKIIQDQVGYLLKVSDSDSSPRLTVIDGAPNGPGDVEQHNRMHKAIREIVDARENRVFTLALFRGKSRGFIFFGIDHSLIDVSSLAAYIHEFWKSYSDIVGRDEQRVENFSAKLPASPSEILTKQWSGYSELAPRNYGEEAQSYAATEQNYAIKEVNIELNETESIKFITACKEKGVTVGSFLAGAMAVELRANRPRSGPKTIRLLTGLDYRKSVDPPVKPLDTTCLTGNAHIYTDVSWDDDAVAVGKRIRDKLDNELLRRDTDPLNRIGGLDRTQVDIVIKGGMKAPSFILPDGLEIVDTLPLHPSHPVESNLRARQAPKTCIISNTLDSKLKLRILLRDDIDETVPDRYRNRIAKFAEG